MARCLNFFFNKMADKSSNLLRAYHLPIPGPDECDHEFASLGHHRCHQCCCDGPSNNAAGQSRSQASSSCEQRWYLHPEVPAPVITRRTNLRRQECSYANLS
jgi:hypothetical protein